MTPRIRLIVVSAVSGIIGIAFGVSATFWFMNQFFLSGLVTSHGAGIVTKVAVLESLHRGKTENASQLLEMQLDVDMMGLTPFLSADSPHNSVATKAAQSAARYRATSNYVPSDPTARKIVEEVLRTGSKQDATNK